MPFVLLLLLMLACLPVRWPEPPGQLGFAGAVMVTWLAIGLLTAVAAILSQATKRAIRRQPSNYSRYSRRYAACRYYHVVGVFAVYFLVLYGLGWGWAVQQACMIPSAVVEDANWLLPGAELLVLSPFLAALVSSWVCYYDAEKALHDAAFCHSEGEPYWTRGSYVMYHVRNNLALVFAPLALLVAADALLHIWPDLRSSWHFEAIAVALPVALFIAMPWVLRLVLALRPLPVGPLRDRLLRTAKRLNFRFSNVLIWNTKGAVANAMVVGILPWLRYILLTDRLVEELTPSEIEAVFGHEIGHVKHRHMLYYLGFLLISLCVLSELWKASGLQEALNLAAREDLAVLPRIAIVAGYILVVFGFLSRRCEGQADIYGCRAVSCDRTECQGHDDESRLAIGGKGLCPTGIGTFILALEKVAILNGMSRDKPGWVLSWRHSTIARRVEFLEKILHDRSLEPRFQKRVFAVKAALLALLLVALYLLGDSNGWHDILTL